MSEAAQYIVVERLRYGGASKRREFVWFHEALDAFENTHCGALTIQVELIRVSDGSLLDVKGTGLE